MLLIVQVASSQGTLPNPTPETVLKQSTKTETVQQNAEVSRERRAQAYAMMLDGQRYVWNLSNPRSGAGVTLGTKLAKESFQKALELDPNLSEAYTALAELMYKSPPNDFDEAIRLANKAVEVNPDNFGGHQIVGRLQTHESMVNRGVINRPRAEKAILGWKEVVRLDPRNAEAFAFLSELYGGLKMPKEQIEALRSWLSSAQPVDQSFFRAIFRQEDLSPDSAAVKLGAALLKHGEIREAVEMLSRAVSDNPNDDVAIELLSRAVDSADEKTAETAIDALQQATFANPGNTGLISLLADIQVDADKIDEATKLLRDSSVRLLAKDKYSAVSLQLRLGDIFSNADRFDDAIRSYKEALGNIVSEGNILITDLDRDFAETSIRKLIAAYRNSNRPGDAKNQIIEARQIFGKDSLFPELELVYFYRGNGQRIEALTSVRALRVQYPNDYSLLKLEAEILTESGKVDEGVSLFRSLIGIQKPNSAGNASPLVSFDDFTNYLEISQLFSKSKRGKSAIDAANQALALAKGLERTQIAKLTLATAFQMSGDHKAAETVLRELLAVTPDNPFALNNLGYFLLERNEKLNEALQLIKKAVDISPTNSSFLDSLGWAYFKLDNLGEAEKYLKSALRYDNSSATIIEHLGDIYEKQGKHKIAVENWRKALKISADADEILRLKIKLGEKTQK